MHGHESWCTFLNNISRLVIGLLTWEFINTDAFDFICWWIRIFAPYRLLYVSLGDLIAISIFLLNLLVQICQPTKLFFFLAVLGVVGGVRGRKKKNIFHISELHYHELPTVEFWGWSSPFLQVPLSFYVLILDDVFCSLEALPEWKFSFSYFKKVCKCTFHSSSYFLLLISPINLEIQV